MTRRKKWIIIGIVAAVLLTGLAAPILFISYVNEKVVCYGDALPYCTRGGDYLLKSQYDLALKEFAQAIQLIPGNPAPYALRGLTYRTMGDYDHAEQDFETALQLSPKFYPIAIYQSNALIPLQQTYFLKGDFASAALTDEKLLKLYKKNNEQLIKLYRGDDTNVIIWLHIDRIRAGQDDKQEFEQNSKALEPSPWQTAIAAFFTGKMSADELVNKASDPDPKTQKQQSCEANFYIAESLMVSDKAKAVPYFQTADQVCPSFFKFAAHATLDQMKAQ